jgi:hypothetical protein
MTREQRHSTKPTPSTAKLKSDLDYTVGQIRALRALEKHLRLMLKAAKS